MTDRPPGASGDGVPRRTYGRRRRRYLALMAVCVVLFVCAWGFVRLVSVPLAVGMCVVAALIPPVAAVVANRRGPDDPWWDDPRR
ncbi:DUF3099 domain-containing protein [Streptomyces sp. 549]|uniref:DUF3099 domain-containing protein n=1 Tax=Streptomyces sp. 549 TaxID=3049076 RepID=UPI0024C274AB|nr:DUF3099 domain-containing protein [Streptomyces sp. 549]MDK1476652.1 DUF3099 domain-containing protein [Streptomyces sp. 549]